MNFPSSVYSSPSFHHQKHPNCSDMLTSNDTQSSLLNYVICALPLTFFLSLCEDDSGDEGSVPQEDRALTQGVLKTLASKLDDLSTCNELIGKHGAALQRSLSELEELRVSGDSTDKVKAVNERATLIRITSNAMINVSSCDASAGAATVSWRLVSSECLF